MLYSLNKEYMFQYFAKLDVFQSKDCHNLLLIIKRKYLVFLSCSIKYKFDKKKKILLPKLFDLDQTPGQNLAPGLEVADPVPDPRNPVPGHEVAANQDLVPLTKSPGHAAGPDPGDPDLERIR